MHDHVAVVDQHPVPVVEALEAERLAEAAVGEGALDVVDDRLDLPVVGRRHDDELVGHHQDIAHLEDDDVTTTLRIGGASGGDRQVTGRCPIVQVSQRSAPPRGGPLHLGRG